MPAGMSYFKKPQEYYRRTQWTYPDTLRIRGSVIPTIISDVMIVTAWAATIIFIEKGEYLPFTLNFPPVIASVLSIIVGLILAFRTNTAYDRFWEGRKLWASLDVQMRNFSRMIWVGMKETPHTQAAAPAASSTPVLSAGHHLFGRSPSPIHHDDDHEKIVVIKLLLAYAVSVKHHLRQEFGTRYYDLEYLLPEGFIPCAATDNVEIKVVHDKATGDRHRHYNEEPWTIHAGNEDGQMSLPLEIIYALSLWVIGENRAGRIESAFVGNMLASINTMTDIFTNMERIVFTPIPLAYSIHLRQVVYLYTMALPFTFVTQLSWGTVPLMALCAFTLFGVEGIGREIENPFGKDSNDLHMDEFCRDLKRELDYIVNLKNAIPGAHA
ncbi:hypothetical protein BG000_009654 [Podila horticola]|nr:hypothetical protein BG000_009654 [Podila horticola]